MITVKFKEEYAKLNKEQKRAVDEIEGPVMVIAGPGTGKTTILTLRIANILRQTDTPPSGILALTFTEAGVKAMRTKLREIIGERALELSIHTFHGFAASIIAEFQEHFPHLSLSNQITDIESEIILREILKQKHFSKLRPISEPDFYLSKIIGAISASKKEAWTPKILRNFATNEIERIKNDPTSISGRGSSKGDLKGEVKKYIEKCERTILFSEIYEKYEEKKKKDRKMDFDDLIFELVAALQNDKLLLQILQEKFLYILVDEHQDTNDSQNLIVKMIADFFESPNLFVVGDEKQAIYRFQGASIENFLNFQKKWRGMSIISLKDNYRSHQSILNVSFKMIEQNYEKDENNDIRIKLKSRRGTETRPVDMVFAPDTTTEEYFLVSKLQDIIKNEQSKTVAIIVRKNIDVSRILSLLESNNIPASAERGINIFTNPAGSLFFSLLEFLRDPSQLESLAETVASGLWNLDFEKQVELIKLIRSGEIGKVGKEIPALDKLQDEINYRGALEYLALIADVSGFTEIIVHNSLFTEVWRAIFGLGRDLARSNNIESPFKLIDTLLAYKKSAEQRTLKIKTGDFSSQITVMTAHSSKGSEFDYVFLPYATEESWISKRHNSYFVFPHEKGILNDIKDERRLFYVALTRAREHIIISLSASENSDRLLTPLRFLDELDSVHILKTDLPTIMKPPTFNDLEKAVIKAKKEKVEFTKQVLLENGLSVTALNHFMNCPSEFFYKSILKLPEPPSASSEKGNAMHEALSNVWKNLTPNPSPRSRRGEKEENQIEKIIVQSVKNYFRPSLLPLYEKEVLLEELLTNAPKVASSLLNHFSQTGTIKTETWVEKYFETRITTTKEKIELKLHGKIDVILENENEISVFDYKTREVMSVNEIRGNTKNSDGSYFRQLIFYKILLEDSRVFEGRPIEPSLVFVKPDSKGRCQTVSLPIQNSDIDRVKSEIKSLLESVWSGKLLSQTCGNTDCKYCAYGKL